MYTVRERILLLFAARWRYVRPRIDAVACMLSNCVNGKLKVRVHLTHRVSVGRNRVRLLNGGRETFVIFMMLVLVNYTLMAVCR